MGEAFGILATQYPSGYSCSMSRALRWGFSMFFPGITCVLAGVFFNKSIAGYTTIDLDFHRLKNILELVKTLN